FSIQSIHRFNKFKGRSGMIIIRGKKNLSFISILFVFTLFCGFNYLHIQETSLKSLKTLPVTSPQNADTLDQRFTEKVLATIPNIYGWVSWQNVKILSDGKTFGYLAKKGTNYAVIYNGKEVTELDPDRQMNVFGGPGPLWNNEGGINFFGIHNKKCVIVSNDIVRDAPRLDSIQEHTISQNGEHVAYFIKQNKNTWVYKLYIDGKEYGQFKNGAGRIALGNDGSFAYVEQGNGDLLLITGDGIETHYKSISNLKIAPDGNTLVYLASPKSDNKLYLYIGGKIVREYNGYSYSEYLTLSSDGQSIAFIAKKSKSDKQECVIVDDHYGEMFDHIFQTPRFLNGTHVVFYFATSNHVDYTVIGDRKFLGQYKFVSDNGKTLAKFWNDDTYVAVYKDDGTVEISIKGHINVNGLERSVVGMVKDIALSPGGESFAYTVGYLRQDRTEQHPHIETYAVVNGETIGESFPAIDKPTINLPFGNEDATVIRSLTFSPNGKSLAYVVKFEDQKSIEWIVVVNGKKSEPFDGILTRLFFDPDGSKVAFGALKGREILWKVIQE
ncbi:MAG: WD40 repeat domain-containing protein, partial [Bacteroidales bacterium]